LQLKNEEDKKFDGIAILINLLIDKKIEGEELKLEILDFFLNLSKELNEKKKKDLNKKEKKVLKLIKNESVIELLIYFFRKRN
jgi:hypothetical protein